MKTVKDMSEITGVSIRTLSLREKKCCHFTFLATMLHQFPIRISDKHGLSGRRNEFYTSNSLL